MSRFSTQKVLGMPLPYEMRRKLAASVGPEQGNLLMLDTTNKYIVLTSGTVPNCISFGFAERDQDSSSTAGNAAMAAWTTFVSGYQNSTIANDALADTDVGVVAWGAGVSTFGKLSNSSGNRSMMGLAFGFDAEVTPSPIVWIGPVAWCVARGVHMADNDAITHSYAADATASTDLGTASDPLLLTSRKLHSRITSIEIIPSADLAATGGTNYRIITVYKIDTLTNVVGPVVGTFDSRTQALAKRTPTQFTLSSTSTDLDMLETDVLGFASLHTASGATIPQSVIRINRKVQ